MWNRYPLTLLLCLALSRLAFGNGEGPFLPIALGNTWVYADSATSGGFVDPEHYAIYTRTIRVTSTREEAGRLIFKLIEKDSGRKIDMTNRLVNGKVKFDTTRFIQKFVDSGWIDPVQKTFQIRGANLPAPADSIHPNPNSNLSEPWMYFFDEGSLVGAPWPVAIKFFSKQDSLICNEVRSYDVPEGQGYYGGYAELDFLKNVGLLLSVSGSESMAGRSYASDILIRFNGTEVDASLVARAKRTFTVPVRAQARIAQARLSPFRATPVWTGEFQGAFMDVLGRPRAIKY